MKYMIVGLGNDGIDYQNTRHNIGFMFLDYISNYYKISFNRSKKFLCNMSTLEKTLLIKPTTYMNFSGDSVYRISDYYNIDTKNILICYDDIDLNLNDIRVKFGGGSAGHNGIKSIDKLISANYWRMRFGVGRPNNSISISEYVISKFVRNELLDIQNIFFSLNVTLNEIINGNFINLSNLISNSFRKI